MTDITNVPQDSDFEYKQGTTLVVTLTFRQSPSAFFNLTNYTIKVTVRRQFGSDDAVIFATTDLTGPGAGLVEKTNPLNGTAEWTIPADVTSAYEWSNLDEDTVDLPYDVELHHTSGAPIYSPIRGTFTLVREVTRT